MNNKYLRSFLALALLLSLLLGACAPGVSDPGQTTEPITTVEVSVDTTAEPPDTDPSPDDGEQAPDPSGSTVTIPSDIAPVTTEPPTTEDTTTEPPATEPPETEPPASVARGFKVHFIDVGQADAALVVCDGKAMLIDGGNRADSNLIYSYLKKQGITHLDYMVATHAHEDHVGGLSGALNYATVDTVFCPVTSYNSQAFRNFVSNVQKQGKSLTIPYVGQSFSLGSATCTVLAVNTYSDANNTSIVLRIVYGSTSFLFMGDAERDVEQVLVNRGVPLKSTVLKVGHHGSYTSTSYTFLNSVMPAYAVISCGQGNSYGHPHEEPLSRLHDADVQIFRTDKQGDIICTSNGSSVRFSRSPYEDPTQKPTEPATEPATEPTTEPTTEPVTEPTTESTAVDPTEDTLESTTEAIPESTSGDFSPDPDNGSSAE